MTTVQAIQPKDALLWLELDSQYTDGSGNRVIKNYGTYPGAPATVKCGDGTTSSTFPTQLSGRHGVSFDGGDYIDTGIVDPFERTDKFSIFILFSFSGSSGYIATTYDIAQDGKGISQYLSSANNLGLRIQSSSSNLIGIGGTNFLIPNMYTTLATTYSGSSIAAGVSNYINGTLLSGTTSNDNLTATIKNGKSFLLGARHNGVNKATFMTGTMHFAAIFPYELTPAQVAYLHHRAITTINLPMTSVSPDQALLWLNFESQYTDSNGKRVITNYGRYPGAPATVQCGDGTTSSTFPTQLSGKRGLSFDGGDYIDTGIVDPFERTDKFSIIIVTSNISTSNGSSSNSICGSADASQNNKGIHLYRYVATTDGYCYIANAISANAIATVFVSNIKQYNNYCITYSGSSNVSGIKEYTNGNIMSNSISLNSLSDTIKNGKSFLIGARWNGVNIYQPSTCNIHFAAIFPFELNSNQVAYLDHYVRTTINAPLPKRNLYPMGRALPQNSNLWLSFQAKDRSVVNGNTVIKNYGGLGPATVTCGDGTTSSTFPTQLSGKRGLSFDGGDYIDTGIVDPFERTDKFSLFVAISSNPGTIGSGYTIFATRDLANDSIGFNQEISDSKIALSLINNSSNRITNRTLINTQQFSTLASTYSGSSTLAGTKNYANNILLTPTTTADSLSATIKNGKSLIIGGYWNGLIIYTRFVGNIYFAAIFPYELTSGEVSSLDHYVRTLINKP